jgi:hypothetical protein
MLALVSSAFGQEIPEIWVVHFDQVIPEKVEVYEGAMKGWVSAFKAAKMGPEHQWFTSSSSDFGYVLASPLGSFSELDSFEVRQKKVIESIGEAKFKELEEKGSSALSEHHTEIARYVAELSYLPANPIVKKPGYSRIGVHYVRPSMEKKFRQVIENLVAALKKVDHGIGFSTLQVMFGEGSYLMIWDAESPEQFFSVNNMAKVLGETLGEEGSDKLFLDWRQSITRFQSLESRPRHELSYMLEGAN